jgi:hypothetical protein
MSMLCITVAQQHDSLIQADCGWTTCQLARSTRHAWQHSRVQAGGAMPDTSLLAGARTGVANADVHGGHILCTVTSGQDDQSGKCNTADWG